MSFDMFFKRPSTGQATTPTRFGAHNDAHVTVDNAEAALALLLEKIHPAAPGWRAVLMTIPGFVTSAWPHGPADAVVRGTVRKSLSADAVCHVFLLADNQLAVVTLEPDSQLLGGLEEALVHAFKQEEGTVLLRRFDLTTQLPELVQMARQKEQEVKLHRAEVERRQAEERQRALSFTVPDAELRVRPHRKRRIVLVVEDDPSTAMLLSSLIEGNINTFVAHTAAEAVALYRMHVPDLVFLDIGLPDVDGLTLLKHIHAADPAAAVVMLTANAYRENLEKAQASGAIGFVAKPFTRQKIQQVVGLLNNKKN